MTSPLERGARCAMVFSHPNHELAVLGWVQRVRPHLIFLTDGGGPEREGETRAALERLGLIERACFLGHGEGELYQALVERDVGFYQELARRLRKQLEPIAPSHVLCDAVELYNPVHDVTLPVVRHALAGHAGAQVFEVPLVYERPGPEPGYEIQRFPAERRGARLQLALTKTELDAKLAARDEIYSLLRAQLGPLLAGPSERFAVEEIGPAPGQLDGPGTGRALRYERRGELLRQRGQVATVITWANHYRPIADALLAASA